MSFFEKFKKFTAPQDKKTKLKVKKRNRKSRQKLINFQRREHSYVVFTGYTKCLDCGETLAMHRLGCGKCFDIGEKNKAFLGVSYGALIVESKITKNIYKPIGEKTVFISYSELYKRLIAGEQFMNEYGKKLSTSDFEK